MRPRKVSDEEARRFRSALAEHRLSAPIAHNSYLINLASPDSTLWRRSIDAFVVELQRAELLGIPYVITHPGACLGGSPEQGVLRVAQALDEIEAQTGGLAAHPLLENTAGQGSCLGWRFEHLAEIAARVRSPERLGFCFDTCHAFAAGYPMASEKQYRATMKQLDATLGIPRIKAIHLNDSRKGLGCRVDRHAHIGRGEMGLEPFRRLLNDRRFRKIPMYLETPKGEENGIDLDAINLRVLRALITR
jgi:deoxyribonuclease-4